MRTNSLSTRLFLSATAWVVVVLTVTGVILTSAYRESAERAFDRRLNFYLRTLVAEVASPEDSPENLPAPPGPQPPQTSSQSLGEPLFELPLSGWYWEIAPLDGDKSKFRVSRSLWDNRLPNLEERGVEMTSAGVRQSYVDGPEGQSLRIVERPVDLGTEGKLRVSVAGDATEIFEETRAFNYYLGGTFLALALGLSITTIFQVRFGLAPLKRISDAIADVRSGRAERLEGVFPLEIAPLARETNALIEANRAIVERARTHVGNLAHALKTPLSVIVNEAGAAARNDAPAPLATKVLEQADIMRDQVTHHLERARMAARVTIVGNLTEVRPVIEGLTRTMDKIYRQRGIAVTENLDAEARFRGERQDLEEIVGNLVDNACKWATSKVNVSAQIIRESEADPLPKLHITVDDDGPGLSEAQRITASQRGRRLDETKPGSGLGLSIVVELAGLYGGDLRLDQAPLGGLRAVVELPAA